MENQNSLSRHKTSSEPQVIALSLFKNAKDCAAPIHVFVSDHETYPTIHTMRRELGDAPVMIMITMFIKDCIDSLSVNQPTKEQVLEMAREIMSDNPTYKPEDFKVFFSNVKKGRYGKDYNRFDLSTVYHMLAVYNDERMTAFEQAIAKRKAEDNSTIRTPSDTKSMHELYDGVVLSQMRENQKKELGRLRQAAISKWITEMHLHFVGMGIQPHEITEEQDVEYRKQNPLDETYIEKFIAQ